MNKLDKANKEIATHFQEEIRIKKDIGDDDRKIDNLLMDLKEREYEQFKLINQVSGTKGVGVKQRELKMSINKLNEQIESAKSSLNDKIMKHNDLIKKREDLQNLINKLSKEPLGSSLNLTYQYYIVLLDNMTLEHRKNQNVNNLRRKEVKMNKLIDQVKHRDDLISKTRNELNKKGVKINQNEEIKSLENLNIEHSFVLPVVIASANDKNDQIYQINNNPKFPKIGNNQNLKADLNSSNSRSKSPYDNYNNPNIIKEKKKFKSKTTEIIDKVKKNELTNLRLNVINDLYPNSKLYYLNSGISGKHHSPEMKNVISFDTRNLNNSGDKGNTSVLSKHSDRSYSRASRKEREIDKKVKNIFLHKNLIGRHRNSPYLKNFNQL